MSSYRNVGGCPLLDEPHVHVDGKCDERVGLPSHIDPTTSQEITREDLEAWVELDDFEAAAFGEGSGE